MQALAFGDLDATISVVDYRLFENGSKSIVWAAKDADGAEITDVAFSPFVPYWIASSNELGTVKVWDLRYAKDPFARINAHHHAVTSVKRI